MNDSPRSVIGIALNFRETLVRLASTFAVAPYKNPPLAPVLYLKTPNTWISSGQPIPCPAGVPRLHMAGTLGIVISHTACRVSSENAFDYVSAFTVVNDVGIPHESFYRPALRERCSDSFCSIGDAVPRDGRHAEFEINVLVNNVLRSHARTSSLVRSIPQLIQDVSAFMTLRPNDILLIGEPEASPLCSPGDKVRVEIPGVGFLENNVVQAS